MVSRSMRDFAALEDVSYISIESYRRSGEALRTPVSVISEDNLLFCWTFGKSGKVKRMRNNAVVRLAKCDARGNIQGEWVAASARVLADRQEAKSLSRRMAEKYGLKYVIGIQLFRLVCFLRREDCLAIEFSPV